MNDKPKSYVDSNKAKKSDKWHSQSCQTRQKREQFSELPKIARNEFGIFYYQFGLTDPLLPSNQYVFYSLYLSIIFRKLYNMIHNIWILPQSEPSLGTTTKYSPLL